MVDGISSIQTITEAPIFMIFHQYLPSFPPEYHPRIMFNSVTVTVKIFIPKVKIAVPKKAAKGGPNAIWAMPK